MIDYSVLKVIWWMILGNVLIVYACTAGFDSGITLYLPFLRSEEDRRVLLNVSAPTWDGNLSWIVFAGGGIFVVWPQVYATAFSGLYAAMLFILFSLFLRPPGYEYRNKIDKPYWRKLCDWGLFISGFLPIFIFGVAMGNCFLGFPFYFEPHTMRIFYTGNFLQLLNPFALLAGVASVVMVLMHGSVYLQRRVVGHLRKIAGKIHVITGLLLLFLFTVAGLLLLYKVNGFTLIASPVDPTSNLLSNQVARGVGAWVQSYEVYPWKFFAPVAAYAGIIESIWAAYYGWVRTAFWASCVAIGGIIATAGFTLFPFIMPSSTNPSHSLTIWDAASSQYGLTVTLYIGVVMFVIILGYKIFAYHSIWSAKDTLSSDDIKKDTHGFY